MLQKYEKKTIKEEGENGYIYARKNFDRELLSKKYIFEIEKLLN